MTLAFMSLDVGMTTAIYILSHLDRSLLEDIRHFNIFDSVLDLWAACVYRSCLLLGATIGVAKNSTLGPRRLRASWTVIALVCLFGGIYTMVKLLLFSEVRKPVRDPWFWALFVSNVTLPLVPANKPHRVCSFPLASVVGSLK